jgi:hypothetical protein
MTKLKMLTFLSRKLLRMLNGLKPRLTALLTELFAFEATRSRGGFKYLAVTGSSASWVKKKDNNPKQPTLYHTASSLSALLTILVDNTVLAVGDSIYKQTIGIPMGTNCAVFLANFYLYTFELAFIRKLISQGRTRELLSFTHTFRYIDDILVTLNPFFDRLFHTIYPSNRIPLNREQTGNHVNYLDFHITHKNNHKHTKIGCTLFEKRTAKAYEMLPLSRYPHAYSFLPSKFSYNIVSSQCHRYSHRCLSKRAFLYHVAVLLFNLHNKHLSLRRLLNKVHAFYKHHMPTPLLFHSWPSFLKRLKARIQLLSKTGYSGQRPSISIPSSIIAPIPSPSQPPIHPNPPVIPSPPAPDPPAPLPPVSHLDSLPKDQLDSFLMPPPLPRPARRLAP